MPRSPLRSPCQTRERKMKVVVLARKGGRYRVGMSDAKAAFERGNWMDRQSAVSRMRERDVYETQFYAKAFARARELQEQHAKDAPRIVEIDLDDTYSKVLTWHD